MALPQGMSSDEIATATFMTGIGTNGALTAVNGHSWKGDKPATYGTDTGFKWNAGLAGTSGGTVTYYLDAGSNWTANETAVWKGALALWAGIADISFSQTLNPDSAVFGLFRNPTTTPPPNQSTGAYSVTEHPQGTIGSTAIPAPSASYISIQTGAQGAYFNFNDTFATLFAGQGGGSGLATAVHEIGHSLGLFHSGPYNSDVNPATQQYSPVDTWQYATMSYISPSTTTAKYYAQYPTPGTSWGTSAGFDREPATPQLLDIAAIQQLYGTSKNSTFSGGQVYGFNSNIQVDVRPFFDFTVNTKPILTIWNSGLGNTLNLSGYGTNSTVNLNPGTFSSVAGLVNNLAIAYGTFIDTFLGGAGDDTIFENADSNTIDGADGSNTVVLRLNRADYTMFRTPSNVVTVTTKAGGVTDTLTNVAALRFADGSTMQTSDIACYVHGTRLAVPGGQRRVESLAIGDLVATASGAARPIKWIGRRAYAGPFLASNPGAQPVRVHAGAIADGVPARDLFVSGRHALFLDGVLVPAEALVNGASVTRCTTFSAVEYFHIELDSHDILLAEGCPAESFMDDGSRGLFQNAADFARLYPGDDGRLGFCAEVVETGAAFAAVRGRVDARADLPVAPEADLGVLGGCLDLATHDIVAGWACSTSGSAVGLEVLDGDRVIGQVLATAMRPDVRDAGFGDGRCGFTLRGLALDPASAHRLQVRRASDGALLGERSLAPDAGAAAAMVHATLDALAEVSDGEQLETLIAFIDEQATRLRACRQQPRLAVNA